MWKDLTERYCKYCNSSLIGRDSRTQFCSNEHKWKFYREHNYIICIRVKGENGKWKTVNKKVTQEEYETHRKLVNDPNKPDKRWKAKGKVFLVNELLTEA